MWPGNSFWPFECRFSDDLNLMLCASPCACFLRSYVVGNSSNARCIVDLTPTNT